MPLCHNVKKNFTLLVTLGHFHTAMAEYSEGGGVCAAERIKNIVVQ